MDNTFTPLDISAAILRTRRHLPHWEQAGCTYFVTFRTFDSIPQSMLNAFRRERDAWFFDHPKPWSQSQWKEYHLKFRVRIERWLDQGYGLCPFRDPQAASIVADALRYFDQKRYCLDEFAVMPNHVHALVMPAFGTALSKIVHSWKSFTASQVIRLLGKSGPLWEDETFDHAVRNWDSLQSYRAYIRRNPGSAGLESGQYVLGCGSGVR